MSVFSAIDFYLEQAGVYPASLCPQRRTAQSFAALEQQLNWPHPELQEAVGQCFEAIVRAQVAAFPENIYWDFDQMLYCLVQDAQQAAQPLAYIDAFEAQLVRLMELFGQQSVIRFRYVHDFSYGFDWARWVKKDPANRQAQGPFSPGFLDYIECRGGELLDLIAQNDAKYHQLDGPQHRNPFGFSRDPEDERRLLERMAQNGQIPVQLWSFQAPCNWELDYAEIRKAYAAEMGIQKKAPSS